MSAFATQGELPTVWRSLHRPRPTPADAAFIGVLGLAVVIVMIETRGLSFFGDEWDFVVDRRGTSATVLLTPHGPHLSLVPILIYKVLLTLFGDGSYLPFRVLAAADLVLMSAVLGLACRARWGRWWGLAPVLLVVTLGPGGVTSLWPFQSGYAISVAAGVVALLALDRGERRTDALASALLAVSLASGSQGIGFTAGSAVTLWLRHGWPRRMWVVAGPAILYGLWYLEYGYRYSQTHLALWKTSLPYVIQALSATLAPLVGLSSVGTQTGTLDITFGVPLALALIAAIGSACWRGWRGTPVFWGMATTLVVLWVAASVSNNGFRPPNEPRYLVPDAVLLLICACEALGRPRLAQVGTVAACLALGVVSATNAAQYGQSHEFFYSSDVTTRAELGALELMRGIVPPQFSPEQPPGILVDVRAGPFFSAVDSFGPFGDSPAAIARQSEATRETVDRELARGELSLSPAPPSSTTASITPTILSGTARPSGSCLVLGSGPLVIRASPHRLQLTAGRQSPLSVTMRRFATAYAVSLGPVPAGTTADASAPLDRAPQIPWQMMLTGPGSRVCTLPA